MAWKDWYNCYSEDLSPEEKARLERVWSSEESWKWKVVYYAPEDPRRWVPKRARWSFGWTCNSYWACRFCPPQGDRAARGGSRTSLLEDPPAPQGDVCGHLEAPEEQHVGK